MKKVERKESLAFELLVMVRNADLEVVDGVALFLTRQDFLSQ